MEYKATLDLKAKFISGLCVTLFAALTIYNIRRIDFNTSTITSLALLSTIVLVVSLTSMCYLLRPLKYEVTENQVIIRRIIGNRIIERNTIKRVILPTSESMKWTIRTFGNGGLFGYFGIFHNKAYGRMTWYATRTNNYVMILTQDNNKIVLTPDDMQMVNYLTNSDKN